MGEHQLTKRFPVEVEDLIDSVNSIDDLNNLLDEALDAEPYIPTDISYQVVGFETSPGGTGTLTFEATFTPDYMGEEPR